jgi:hypothetical protein
VDLPDLGGNSHSFFGVLWRCQQNQIVEVSCPKSRRIRKVAGGMYLNFVVPEDGRPQVLFDAVLID